MVAMTDNDAPGRSSAQLTLAELNDTFRQGRAAGQMLITDGVVRLGGELLNEVLRLVRSFGQFNSDNDPYGEHDFGAISVNSEQIFWKIDYYDADLRGGSSDATDPNLTTRILTIMLASEY